MFRSAGRYKDLSEFLFSLFRIHSETPKTIIRITYYKIWSSFISQRSMERQAMGVSTFKKVRIPGSGFSWAGCLHTCYICTYLGTYDIIGPPRPKKIRMQSSGLSTFFSLRFNVLKLILIGRIGCSLSLPYICVQPVSNCKPWSHATSYYTVLYILLCTFSSYKL